MKNVALMTVFNTI